jgi:hypothetical protein
MWPGGCKRHKHFSENYQRKADPQNMNNGKGKVYETRATLAKKTFDIIGMGRTRKAKLSYVYFQKMYTFLYRKPPPCG